MRVSPPTALSGTASASTAANEAYRNAQKRANQQPSPSIDDFINTIGQQQTFPRVMNVNRLAGLYPRNWCVAGSAGKIQS